MLKLTPPIFFDLTAFDTEFAARTTPAEWQRILVLRDHPDFMRGLARYGELIPPYFSDNVILNKVVTEAWRFEILVYMLYLYDTRDPADPRSGLIVANLQELCERQQCASRGRVIAILGIMRLGGYLKRSKSAKDSRVVQLEPSPFFVDIVEGWNQRIFQIIDAIVPDDNLAEAHQTLPRLGWEMRKRGALGLLEGWKLLDPFPEVNHFVIRDGGWMLLLTCVAESLHAGDGKRITPVSLDLKSFGARFGVSRSHLRRLLESAYAADLLDAPPRDGSHIVLAPKLVASFLACMASELGYYRGHGRAAKDMLTASAA
jgi:hypothetical protein